MKIVDSKQMQILDAKCINEYGIPQELLMENAALATLNAIIKHYENIKNKKFLIVCGTGNNGGDGLALARLLYSYEADVKIYISGSVEKYKGASALNYKISKNLGLKFISTDSYEQELVQSDFIIDALFGVGLNRNIEGKYRCIIEKINASNKKIISLDIPSGINASTGNIMGCAVNADVTVTYGYLKYGNILYPGYKNNGKVYHNSISFPKELGSNINAKINLPIELTARKANSHKGDYGKTLFICGSANYLGAPYFSAAGFLNSGGGYSRLATVKSIIPTLAVNAPDIVYYPMNETESGSIAYSNKDKLLEIIKDMKLLVIGCGISLNNKTKTLIKEIIKETDIPMIIDADGLTILSEDLSILKDKKAPVLLTPHLGEMSRLCSKSTNEIKNDPVTIIKEFSKTNSCIIILKGANTQISFPNGDIWVNLSGNSSLAVAGSGDLLCGVIAGQYALGFDFANAIRMGVFLHGLNGEFAGLEFGQDGITTKKLLNFMPQTLKQYRINYENISAFYFNFFNK